MCCDELHWSELRWDGTAMRWDGTAWGWDCAGMGLRWDGTAMRWQRASRRHAQCSSFLSPPTPTTAQHLHRRRLLSICEVQRLAIDKGQQPSGRCAIWPTQN